MGNNGSSIWTDSPAGRQIQERLSEEKTLQSINRLLDRIDTLEKAVENLTTIMAQGPGLVSMAADTVDESYRQAARRGIDVEQRLAGALQIAEKLTDPKMVEKLDNLLAFADQAPGLISMMVDMADESYRKAQKSGVNPEDRLSNALQIAEKLTATETVTKLNDLLVLAEQAPGLVAMLVDSIDEEMRKANTGGLDINNLMDYGKLIGLSLSDAKAMPETKVTGVFGLLRALRDPDRQKALGFLMNFAKAFGSNMQ